MNHELSTISHLRAQTGSAVKGGRSLAEVRGIEHPTRIEAV